MTIPSAPHILRLYKDLLRFGQQLKYTNKDYFHGRIIKEFKKNKALVDGNEISFCYKKGVILLERKTVQ